MNQPNKKSSKTRIPSRQKNVLEEAVHQEPTSTNVNALKQYLDEVGTAPIVDYRAGASTGTTHEIWRSRGIPTLR